MAAQIFTNTFVGGMMQDIDPHEQPNSTYRYAIGGRISYNRSGDAGRSLAENIKAGASRAFANSKGNSAAFSLCPGYQIVGSVETAHGTVLLSTNGTHSEIGYLTVNDNIYKEGFAVYTTLFNDRNDPNGDLLHFSLEHYAHGFTVLENEFAERVYWVDGYNQKRVINLPLFYKPDGTPHHSAIDPCGGQSVYPKYLSVHAFDERMDLVFPRLKFKRRIAGQLKSGTYQLVVKYSSENGHSSVWSPATRRVFVTDQKMDGEITVGADIYPDAYKMNHHNRTMGASNIMTSEGLEWELKGVDTRWDYIHVGYIYHASSVAFQEANEFAKLATGSQPVITVQLDKHTGNAILKDELDQRFETVLSVGTTAQQENRTWDGNLQLLPDLAIDLRGVSIRPKLRYFRADDTLEPLFTPVFNPVTARDDGDPITNTFPVSSTIEIQSFTGQTELYEIVDDYANYKGQQFEHLFRGYFRGETQPFGFVWIDRKGNPLFVQHIQDYTFPNQYERIDPDGNPADWTLTRAGMDGKYDLRIMGASFSGIRLPVDLLYDRFGKLNVSGFMIVRTARVARIANQGLLFNCNFSPNGKTQNLNDGYIHPAEFWDNRWALQAAGLRPSAHAYQGITGSYYERDVDPQMPFFSFSAGGFFNFHSPDILIEQVLAAPLLAGQLEKVGFVHKAYSEAVDVFSSHFYSKVYKTLPLDFADETAKIQNERGRLGSKSRVKLAMVHDQAAIHVYEKFDPEVSDQFDYRVHVQAFFPGQQYAWKATQQPYSVILKLLDWKLIDSIEHNGSRATYPLVNWKVTPSGYYTPADESSLEKRRYFSTGHFQPITQQVLDSATKHYGGNGAVTAYEFNDVEVWGGDCYVNLWDFTRMYPEYSNCEKSDNAFPDYSVSVISPVESKYNLALLFGRKYAANCVMPQRTSCTGEHVHLSNGIMPKQPEDWSYNEVLLLEESCQFYFAKPAGLKIVASAPNMYRWSPKKLLGEAEDSYRQKLTGDYSFVSGELGRIQRFAQGFDYLYIIQEKAFGAVLTRLERFVPTDTGEMVVKSADAASGVRYISKVNGTQHPNSVWQYDNQIGFVDARMGKILVFGQAGLNKTSEQDHIDDAVSEMTLYFDRTVVHTSASFVDIVSGLDLENNQVLTTFLHEVPLEQPGNPNDRQNEVTSFTLTFDEKSGVFHGYEHYTPRYYFNSRRMLLAANPQAADQVFLFGHGRHGQWFGAFYPTILEFIVNPQPNVAKTFDNGFINLDGGSHGRISQIAHRAASGVHTIVPVTDERAIFQEDLLRYPMHEQDELMISQRLRGHYLVVTVTIDNGAQLLDGKDLKVAVTSFDTKFRISHPVQY
ncbi:hypothetical protein [Dyadobacter sp. BHUBP1]|uniref:hypothetical protein n=1 Tax=Dyadobacter sp. BHUBP1 TaxID=3424178 RepID=UPI003D32F645